MDVTTWKAQIRVVPAGGFVQVRRQGETTNRTVACARHLSTAALNEWVQVIEAEGQPVAIALLGTGATVIPPNPDPTPGGGGPATITAPVVWSGVRKWTPYNGNTPAGFSASAGANFYFGRSNSTYFGNRRDEGMAIYAGLKGLNITAAKVTFDPSPYSETSPDANTRLALWLAPDARPADQSSGHPAGISLVADQALGASWPPSAPIAVTLPAAWIAHLKAGTANGVGLLNNTMAPTTGIWTYGATASPMTVTYQ